MPAGNRGTIAKPEGDAGEAVLRPAVVLPLTEDVEASPELPHELKLAEVVPDPVLDVPVPVREPVADPEQVPNLERSDGIGVPNLERSDGIVGAAAGAENKQGRVAEEVGRKPNGLGPS